MKRRIFLALALWPTLALAHSYKQGDMAIGHAWGLPSKDGTSMVFFPLLNGGAAADTLISASSDVAATIELRVDGDATKPASTGFVIEPKKPIPMRPNAWHLALSGIAKPLLAGDKISLKLKFLAAGEATIEVHIQDKAGE